jgi:hypothetical protein
VEPTETTVIDGHLDAGAADFVYLPVEVPGGVARIDVSYSYDTPAVPEGGLGNSCDIGVFDERGVELGGDGFRGWSGGSRGSFFIGAGEATPGYLPGLVNAGTWHVVLGPYTVAPSGLDYRVTVTLTRGRAGAPFTPDYPPTRAAGRGRAWYRGDCHLHTVHSDGRRTPAEVAAAARAAGLDFIVSTEHNTSASHAAWGRHAGPDLLILTGEEVTTRNGHFVALGLPAGEWVDWRYRARDGVFERIAEGIREVGGLVVPAHPYCPYIGCQWKFGFEHADATEVWTGPWTYDDESAVETWNGMLVASVRTRGRWLPAMGNSDAHSSSDVVGLPRNVVLADDLSRDAVLAGLRAGRCWIAESSDVSLTFGAAAEGRAAGIGGRLAVAPDAAVTVTLTVGGVPNGTVRIVTDQGQVLQRSLPAGGSGGVAWRTTPSAAGYVRAEVRHPLPDGAAGAGWTMRPALPFGPMAALTNPVFLGQW